MKKLFSLLACALLVPSFAAAQEKSTAAGLKVEKAVAATSVENREPVGESKEFEATVGTVWCWTKITAQTTPATIKHVWYVGEQKVFEKALEIKYPATRTWSAKTIKAGNWRVDISDDAGTVLASVSFVVK
jgi:dihydroxyacetone kinase